MDFAIKKADFDLEEKFVNDVYEMIFKNDVNEITLSFEDKRTALYYCLDEFLTQDERELLILQKYYGISIDRIADLYNVMPGVVYGNNAKLKNKLRSKESILFLRNGYVRALYLVAEEHQNAYKECMAKIKEYEKSKEAC